jgi:type II secretory pathway component GspD/PulD (secretin)
MRVYFMPRAVTALSRMARRWRDTARIPEVFDQDIDDVVARIAQAPTTGAVAQRTSRRTVYRMAAHKTKLHLYYVVDEAKAVVKVLQVWSQFRAGPPKL